MATTIPFPYRDYVVRTIYGPTAPTGAGLGAKVEELIEAYETAQRDLDVTTDPEDAAYYGGVIDGLTTALNVLLGVTAEDWTTHTDPTKEN